jgi:hypothetical protein
MKLFVISQDINTDYDTYDSAVVAAESEDDARTINPSRFVTHTKNGKWMGTYSGGSSAGEEYEMDGDNWVEYQDIQKIKVKYIGAGELKRGVVLASFNAG